MTKLKEIELMNETMLEYLKTKGLDTTRNEVIKEILKDEACFFKMEMQDAYMILEDVGITSHIKEIYWNLISRKEYYRLQQERKIQGNLKVQYETYQEGDLFKNRQKS